MDHSNLVVASNRGPLSFGLGPDGAPERKGSGGGLAAALHPLLRGTGATWVACAMSDADRKASAAGLMVEEGLRILTVEPDAEVYRMAYDVISNATLWFLHHHLFDLTRRPRLDRHWAAAWDAYRDLNEQFAERVASVAHDGATVLVQDYHLTLVPGLLARARPDLCLVHFSHTPFADPGIFRVLPEPVARELLEGMAAAACGFHTRRWQAAFEACCADHGLAPPTTFVSALGPDPAYLAQRAASAEVAAARDRLAERTGGRRVILRVDRMEPSKNLVRGMWAMDELLREQPELVGQVVMLALAYASRENLPEYQAYRAEVEHTAAVVNARWPSPAGDPVILDVADDADRSFAALTTYDVLLVNPVRDGLNLVAKEGPLVNHNDGVLVVSREAGAHEELAAAALTVNPFDVSGTATALAQALALDPSERRQQASELHRLAGERTPADWLTDQLAEARG